MALGDEHYPAYEPTVYTVTFTGNTDVILYDKTEFSSAHFVGLINDGTNYTKLISEVGSHASNVGAGNHEIVIAGTIIDAEYTVLIIGDNVVLRIDGEGSKSYTLKYYETVNNLL